MDKEELSKPTLLEDLGMMFANEKSKIKYRFGIYKCGFCGTEFKTQTSSIKKGDTKSCGCLKEKISKEGTNRKHNLTNTRIYGIWANIKNRTLNPKHMQFPNYGGRGITICDEWKNAVKSFYDWAITNGYEENKGLSIDRIDNDGNYEPDNCRWTTGTIQSRNKRVYKNECDIHPISRCNCLNYRCFLWYWHGLCKKISIFRSALGFNCTF